MWRIVLTVVCLLAPPASGLARVVPLARRPQPCAVEVTLTVRTGVTSGLVDAMQREVERIWRPMGVAVVWSAQEEEGHPSRTEHIPLHATVDEADLPPALGRLAGRPPLAWIWFVDGHRTTVIHVSVAHARMVLRSRRVGGRRLADRPALFEQYLAQALGRSLAHEIGHYLLGSTVHTESGLMRASFTPDDLLTTRLDRFELGADEERILTERSGLVAYCRTS